MKTMVELVQQLVLTVLLEAIAGGAYNGTFYGSVTLHQAILLP
jgi:hypothetical protein